MTVEMDEATGFPLWRGDPLTEDGYAVVEADVPLGPARLLGFRGYGPGRKAAVIDVEVTDRDGDLILIALPNVLALLLFTATGIEAA